jgi:hypothetical protein
MHPEVEVLGIPVANLDRTLGKNSVWWSCIIVVSSPKFRFIAPGMKALEGCRIVEAVNTRGVGQTELRGAKNDRTIVWSFKSSH